MEILTFPSEEFKIFLLILIRVSVILFMFPVFESPVFPARAKAGLALVMSLALFPVVKDLVTFFPGNIVELLVLVGVEFMIGIALGLTVRIFFGAVQFAGQVIGFQMGFSMINVIDPQSGANISMMSQIGYLVALLIFMMAGGHHIMITAIVDSFRIIDMGSISLKAGLLDQLRFLLSQMFVLGIKIAAPAMAALLFTSLTFGISAKFAPQMNILIVAFPIKIVVGLFMFGTTLQIIWYMTERYTGSYRMVLTSLMKWMGG